MAFDFKKLTADVKAAMNAGDDAAALVPDRGSCNMDGVILTIPRIRENKVLEALSEAGVYTHKGSYGWHGTGYMINPHVGQADKRYVACNAIAKHLRESGYEVSQFYMMD